MLTRGIKPRVDRMINDLLSRYYPLDNVPNPITKQREKVITQLAVRPIQLWEVVFPETALDEVLSLIGPYNWNPKHNTQLAFLRKMLGKGIKKLPPQKSLKNFKNYEIMRKLITHDIEVAGIGIKKDHIVDGWERL
jgi:hypothetical protein